MAGITGVEPPFPDGIKCQHIANKQRRRDGQAGAEPGEIEIIKTVAAACAAVIGQAKHHETRARRPNEKVEAVEPEVDEPAWIEHGAVNFLDALGIKEGHHLRGQARRAGADRQFPHAFRAVAGFLLKLAQGGDGGILGGVAVAGQAGGQRDHAPTHGRPPFFPMARRNFPCPSKAFTWKESPQSLT